MNFGLISSNDFCEKRVRLAKNQWWAGRRHTATMLKNSIFEDSAGAKASGGKSRREVRKGVLGGFRADFRGPGSLFSRFFVGRHRRFLSAFQAKMGGFWGSAVEIHVPF